MNSKKIKFIILGFAVLVLLVGFGIYYISGDIWRSRAVVLGALHESKELMLVSYTDSKFGEHWKNSIDGDFDGLNGTTLAQVKNKVEPHVIYKFLDEQVYEISSIRILADTGLRKRERYFLTEFTMQASSDGSKYETIFDHVAKVGGAWQTYSFEPFRAKYIKLILHQPINKEWIQLGEFEVY